jgi:MarR family transcriptional regulator, organic hydroperoxide resistance regulator
MNDIRKFDASEDMAVTWARRKEHIRSILRLFRILAGAVRKHAEATEVYCHISSAQLWALYEVGKMPGMRNIDLAKSMAIDAVSAREIGESLVERGLLVREDTLGDGKSSRLFLSDTGSALVASTPFPSQGILTSTLEALDDEVLADLSQCLQAVVGAMPIKPGNAGLTPLTDIL